MTSEAPRERNPELESASVLRPDRLDQRDSLGRGLELQVGREAMCKLFVGQDSARAVPGPREQCHQPSEYHLIIGR